jgi:hypothetical protein
MMLSIPSSGREECGASCGSLPSVPGYLTRKGRDLRIDLLRGFCVLAMIVDHVAGASPLYLLTGGNRFFTSAAEGFILVSGFTAGLVYRRLVARDGIGDSMVKALRRAFSLYLLTIGLTLLLAPISEVLPLPWARSLDLSHAVSFVVSVLTLHRTYFLADVMSLYTLLFATMPLALLLMEYGHTRTVLIASWLLWFLYQLFPWSAAVTWPINGGDTFPFSAWQVLFFTALVLGYKRDRIPSLTQRGFRRLHLLTGLGTAALIVVCCLLLLPAERLPFQFHDLHPAWDMIPVWSEQNLAAKAAVRPERIAASAVVFGFFFLSLTRWWKPLSRPLKPLLLPLGQNALYAYAVHFGMVVAVALVLMLLGLPQDNPWLNAAIQVTAVALIWLMTRGRFLAVTPRTRPYWYASTMVLAVLTVTFLQLPRFDSVPPRPINIPVTATPVAGSSLPESAATRAEP